MPNFMARFEITNTFVVLCAGKATLIIVGGHAAGATIRSAVDNFLHIDIVSFLGMHSTAVRKNAYFSIQHGSSLV